MLWGFWAAKASNWTPASWGEFVQRIQRPSTVCLQPASVRGWVAVVTVLSVMGLPMAVSQPLPSARWFSSVWSTGGGGGTGRGEVPHAVGDGRLVSGHGPGGFAGVAFVYALDAHGL